MGRRKEEMARCCIKNSTRSIRVLRTGGGVRKRRAMGIIYVSNSWAHLCLEFVLKDELLWFLTRIRDTNLYHEFET